METTVGLFDGIVLQRNQRGTCEAKLAGTCKGSGIVRARVTSKGRVVRGFARVPVGRAARGRFKGRLIGLPAGGPYVVELTLADRSGRELERAAYKDVLVGDVWLLGGQSNMEGIGWLQFAARPDPRVRAFYMHDVWNVAADPIHNLAAAVDPVHIEFSGGRPAIRARHVGVGPGVAYGQAMARLTGVPQGLIACAHGGTCMAHWDPALKGQGGRSLYGAMIRRFRKNGSRVAGLVWYQGCSDAYAEAEQRLYFKRMVAFVRAVRRDVGDPRLPVAMVQIAGVNNWGTPKLWNGIQEAQRRLPQAIERLTLVPAIDLAMDDPIHLSGFDQNRLGRRLANAMDTLQNGRRAGRPPIDVAGIRVVPNPRTRQGDVVITFKNVVGALTAPGRPSGFEIVSPEPNHEIHRVDLDGNRAILHTCLWPVELEGMQVHYGYGTKPYCNVTDEADRSLPVFGPLWLAVPRALTGYVRKWKVSPPVAVPEDFARVRRPARVPGAIVREFPTGHSCVGTEFASRREGTWAIFFTTRFRCVEPMKLAVHAGYDGPLKLWVDGRELFCDVRGDAPIAPYKVRLPASVSRGPHALSIALGSNHGWSSGIYVNIERLDVPRALRYRGPAHWKLPVFAP